MDSTHFMELKHVLERIAKALESIASASRDATNAAEDADEVFQRTKEVHSFDKADTWDADRRLREQMKQGALDE
jgi:hypothetical protein